MEDSIRKEFDRRMGVWRTILEQEDHNRIMPLTLRKFSLSGGAQGVWVDKARTRQLTEEGSGVTVSLMHTGTVYGDDLSEDGLLYHYPVTARPKARDESEIIATKNARKLGLPIFVITPSEAGLKFRKLLLAWVEDWDDAAKLFLVTFGDSPPLKAIQEEDVEETFYLNELKKEKKGHHNIRLGQIRFRFAVFKRYGASCAVCGLDIPELVDAAHIKPNSENGSNHPQNGIVLCPTHHRAFDTGFFAIEPITLKIKIKNTGPQPSYLGIKYRSIEHLPLKPHIAALTWFWEKWNRKS